MREKFLVYEFSHVKLGKVKNSNTFYIQNVQKKAMQCLGFLSPS